MYSITSYGKMIADSVRMDAYARALRQAVKPDSVVLDIGTGIGIFAMLACQFGARRVYAIEIDNAIQLAKEIAAANGFADRITFIQDLSTRVTLPEQVDVIISDLRGVLPLFRHHIPSITDARKRFLAPGGVLIPQRDTLWAAVAEAYDLWGRDLPPENSEAYGLDLYAARQIVTNTWRRGRISPGQLLVAPRLWANLDYNVITSPNVSADIIWPVIRAGTAHGINLWFDSVLATDVSFSNAPGAPELIYSNAFFPWTTPVALAVGDEVSVTIRGDLVGEDYIWRWETCVMDQSHPRRVKAHFKQSSFFSVPLSPSQLHKRAANHLPTLNEDGQIDQFILSLMDGQTPLGEIAQEVSTRFPTQFLKWQDALTRVGELSLKYSR